MDTHDLAFCKDMSEAALLNVLKNRFENKKFSTFAGSVLLALSSPEKNCKEELQEFRSLKSKTSAVTEPAHLFSFLSKIYRQVIYDNSPHSIIISGETLAGKTVTANHAVMFLSSKTPEIASKWECIHVLLEAFLSVPHEDTSSTSTRHVQVRKIFFDSEGICSGGSVSIDGVDYPRVSLQARKKPNFNIFYFIVNGLDSDEREQYFLNEDNEYQYLQETTTGELDYQEKLLHFRTAFRFILGSQKDWEKLLRTISAILHLGNIPLRLSDPGIIEIKDKTELLACSELLGVEVDVLKEIFLEHDPSLTDCQSAIDEFSMILYSILCSWIVQKINESLQKAENFHHDQLYISILDLYGYKTTPPKQDASDFIVNTINEKVKELFCSTIQEETSVDLKYNDACTDLLYKLQTILTEQFHTPTSKEEFQIQLYKVCERNPFAKVSKDEKSVLECNHFFKNISYDISELYTFAQHSTVRTLSQLVEIALQSFGKWMDPGQLQHFSPQRTKALFCDGIFQHLNEVLEGTIPHFVCCIRTDSASDAFSSACVLRQLKTHGITRLVSLVSRRKIRTATSDLLPSPNSDLQVAEYIRSRSSGAGQLSPLSKRKKRFVGMFKGSDAEKSDKSLLGALRPRKRDLQSCGSQGSNDIAADAPIEVIERSESETLSILCGNVPLPSKSPKLPISQRLRGEESLSSVHFTEKDENESDDSLCLSADELSEISELSNDEIQETNPTVAYENKLFVKSRTQSDPVQNNSFIQRSIQAGTTVKIESTPERQPASAKRREEFLFLYSCGSLLRTIFKQEDSISSSFSQMVSPHRVSDVNVAMNFHQNSRGRSNSVEGPTEAPAALRGVNTDGAVPENDELLDEWKGMEQAEITPELADWERRSVRLRRHKSILPLLKLESGDAVINRINYDNPIRTTPRVNKPVITFKDVQGVSFQAYAENRFQVPKKMAKLKPTSSKYRAKMKKLISASKTPLSIPLHSLRAPLHDIALENFKHILLYMLTKPGANKGVDAMTHVRAVVRHGLERSTLRDEIYCQLVKQTHNNLKERCESLMWELMAICTGCFAPSYFLKNLIKYFEDVMENPGDVGAWASYCKDRLLKTAERGKRLFVPIQKEINAVQERKPLIEIFHFVDGKQKQIPIYSSTTSEEALEFLLQMTGLSNSIGYMIFEQYLITDEEKGESQTVERSLLASEVICTSLSKFNSFFTSFANKPHITVEGRFFVKRKLFLDNRFDKNEDNLLFYQLSQSIRAGELLVQMNDALMLGSLWLQITNGDYKEGLQISPKEFIPENIISSRSAREWRKDVVPRYQESAGLSRADAIEAYLEYCKQLPFFGYHMFPVDAEEVQWNLPDHLFLGIHQKGVYLLSCRKEIFHSFSYLDILTHSSTPYCVTLGFGKGKILSLRTNKGDEILSLIIDYKYQELKDSSA